MASKKSHQAYPKGSIRQIAVSAMNMSPEAAAAALRIKEMEALLQKNPYFEKYMPKLEELKKNDPIEYLRRLDKLHAATVGAADLQKQKAKEAEEKKNSENPSDEASTSATPSANMDDIDKNMLGKDKAPTGLPFDLNKLLKMELVKDKTAKEIGDIWKQYFSSQDSICAVVPKKKFVQIYTLAQVCPQFIYPVPRDDGYEIYLGEWKGHMLFFTSLVEYKKSQENAPVAVAMHHYPNLQDSHGIVLMASKINSEYISVQDAQYLAYAVELFYGTDDGELVRTFRYKPQEFKYEMVIERIEDLVSSTFSRPKNPPQSKGNNPNSKKK